MRGSEFCHRGGNSGAETGRVAERAIALALGG
jgi:hypothetical protein